MPEFIRLLIHHRPKALHGAALHQVFPIDKRQPERLRALYESWRKQPARMRRAAPPWSSPCSARPSRTAS